MGCTERAEAQVSSGKVNSAVGGVRTSTGMTAAPMHKGARVGKT